MNHHHDDGNITITAALTITALITLTAAIAHTTTAITNHHHAQLAANLSATAAAHSHQYGQNPCHTAHTVATKNHATITHCATHGPDVTIIATHRNTPATATAGPT
ncbi:Rv3654c family TadE-like protein [Corynebacterium aquilae]|uniref:Uncharacterized protein n=1 Tax=Corynebacterium aquilae DSM 44791 TaxID=1431546 RepID=A0A1L7CDE5_9CORY|nr:Rv3654c family TadE-like protein [Corynebacterium aquilae]APT83880.1 hypothetical protein CAQU_00945 [Corynebacterium aquilae DSM 44791]